MAGYLEAIVMIHDQWLAHATSSLLIYWMLSNWLNCRNCYYQRLFFKYCYVISKALFWGREVAKEISTSYACISLPKHHSRLVNPIYQRHAEKSLILKLLFTFVRVGIVHPTTPLQNLIDHIIPYKKSVKPISKCKYVHLIPPCMRSIFNSPLKKSHRWIQKPTQNSEEQTALDFRFKTAE